MKLKTILIMVVVLMLLGVSSCNNSTKPKEKLANVVVSLSTSDGGSVVGAVVTLTNNNGNPVHVYGQIANSNNVNFTDVVFGTYTLTVSLTGYTTLTNNNFSVQVAFVNQPITILPISQNYVIGGPGPAGGLIFYDKGFSSDGWRYLEAAPAGSDFTINTAPGFERPGKTSRKKRIKTKIKA